MRSQVRVVLTTDAARVRSLAENLSPAGGSLHTGWALPERPFDLRPTGVVAAGVVTPSDAAAVALAASRCAGVVAAVPDGFDQPWVRELLGDLHRLAPVRLDEPAAAASLPLTDEQAQLLELIAGGATAAQAAATLYLSLRSVERRLALTRRALRVHSTAEAIGRWLAASGGGR